MSRDLKTTSPRLSSHANRPKQKSAATEAGKAFEWVIGALSAVIVCAVIGFLCFEAFTSPHARPDLSVVVDRVVAATGGYAVEFRVLNAGEGTAAAVQVQGEIRDGAAILETGSVTFDYVPANAKHAGALIFATNPEGYALTVSAKGYIEP